MGMLKIDESKCKKDAICAGACPVGIIRMRGEGGYPVMVPGGEKVCLLCGHCVAVCPHDALDHERIPRRECPPIEKDLVITERQAVQFLRSRRSIRAFDDRPVTRETLQRLIEIGRYAPTGSNAQGVEWIAYADREKIRGLAGKAVEWVRGEMDKKTLPRSFAYLPMIVAAWDRGMDTLLWNAPALVIATAPNIGGSELVDVSLALCYLELAATTLGLGSCWAGILRWALQGSAEIRAEVGLPDDRPNFYPMILGYPKYRYYRLPTRKPPKIHWK